MNERQLLLGNEALALGAYHAGVRVATAYPGTPSTEVTESFAKFSDVHAQWSPNEKVALEVAYGAAIGGARAICSMKHVGLNVAADPLFTASYTGINGGLVIVVADDPGMHSSQNEQDSRFYARSAHIPMLEPSDSQQAYDLMIKAFEISERYDTPVLLRMTTRVAHARGVVTAREPIAYELKPYVKDIQKYVMMPGMARARHIVVEARDKALSEFAKEMAHYPVVLKAKRGIVASGACYEYVREALGENVPVFKPDMVYPLPLDAIKEFASSVDELIVVEELEPFTENQLKAHGIACRGKELFGVQGELCAQRIAEVLGNEKREDQGDEIACPIRPPVLCPGCPHRAVYRVLSKLKVTVTGDIGCYTLGALPPLSAMDACLCMGASIGMSLGLEKARGTDFARKTVAIIGDSTFMHSGITGLIDCVYNGGTGVVLILDNSTTGMTGHQQHPGTGRDLKGNAAPQISIPELVRALGVKNVVEIDPFDVQGFETVMKAELAREELSVVIAKRPCALLDKAVYPTFAVDQDACKKCGQCLRIGCPAIENRGEAGVYITESQCAGCGLCAQICPFNAIGKGQN